MRDASKLPRLFGGLFMAIGIMIMGISGLCSLVFAGEALRDGGMAVLILLYGGIPFLIGLGLFYAGRKLLRRGLTINGDDTGGGPTRF